MAWSLTQIWSLLTSFEQPSCYFRVCCSQTDGIFLFVYSKLWHSLTSNNDIIIQWFEVSVICCIAVNFSRTMHSSQLDERSVCWYISISNNISFFFPFFFSPGRFSFFIISKPINLRSARRVCGGRKRSSSAEVLRFLRSWWFLLLKMHLLVVKTTAFCL